MLSHLRHQEGLWEDPSMPQHYVPELHNKTQPSFLSLVGNGSPWVKASMPNSHPGIFPSHNSPNNSHRLAVRKKTRASFSISCLCKSVISRTGFKCSLPWTRQCSLAYNPRAQKINSHSAQPLMRVQGLFQRETGHPSSAWLTTSSRWTGSGQVGFLLYDLSISSLLAGGADDGKILEQWSAWGCAWAGAEVPVPVTRWNSR